MKDFFNCIIISAEVENRFYKIQHPVTVKALNKLGLEGSLSTNKG